MPLTADEYKALIIDEVGDQDGFLAARIDTCWDFYAVLPVGPVRFYRAKIRAITLFLGACRGEVSFQIQGDLTVWLKEKSANLREMLTATQAELKEELAGGVTGGRRPRSGQLTATAPLVSPTGAPDANSPTYRGDPSRPGLRVQP